jgi:hypothetical protein
MSLCAAAPPRRPLHVRAPQVRWEDQKQINEFGRLNTQRVELQAEIDVLKVRAGGATPANASAHQPRALAPQAKMETYQTASEVLEEAVILADGDEPVAKCVDADGRGPSRPSHRTPPLPRSHRIMVGESYADASNEEAQAFLQRQWDADKARLAALTAKADAQAARLAELKRLLYSRFGKAINLDE